MSRLIAVCKYLILRGSGGEAAATPSIPANAITDPVGGAAITDPIGGAYITES